MGGEGIGSRGTVVVIEAFSQTVGWWRIAVDVDSDAVGILDLVGMANRKGLRFPLSMAMFAGPVDDILI